MRWAVWLRRGFLGTALVAASCVIPSGAAAARPVVEIEEDVYSYEDARNGADPLWNISTPLLVR